MELKAGQKTAIYKYFSGAIYDGKFKGWLKEVEDIHVYNNPSGAVHDGELKGGQQEGRRGF